MRVFPRAREKWTYDIVTRVATSDDDSLLPGPFLTSRVLRRVVNRSLEFASGRESRHSSFSTEPGREHLSSRRSQSKCMRIDTRGAGKKRLTIWPTRMFRTTPSLMTLTDHKSVASSYCGFGSMVELSQMFNSMI